MGNGVLYIQLWECLGCLYAIEGRGEIFHLFVFFFFYFSRMSRTSERELIDSPIDPPVDASILLSAK